MAEAFLLMICYRLVSSFVECGLLLETVRLFHVTHWLKSLPSYGLMCSLNIGLN